MEALRLEAVFDSWYEARTCTGGENDELGQ